MIKFNILTVLILVQLCSFGQQPKVYLWPGNVPGEIESKHEPVTTPDHSRDVIRLTEVTNPAFRVYKPIHENNLGTGIIICPGGGYSILAYNLEG